MIKCQLEISDSPLSSETMQSFSQIIILLESLLFSEKYGLILQHKIIVNNLFQSFLTISCEGSFVICRVTSFYQVWFY